MIRKPKLIGLIVLLLGFACLASAQRAAIGRADELFAARAYARSVKFYKKAIARDSTNSYVLRQLGEVCARTKRFDESLYWFGKLVRQADCQPADWLAYAKAMKESGQYEKATECLLHFTDMAGPTSESSSFALQLESVMNLFRDSASFDIKALPINTGETDMSPVLIDNQLVFCSSGMQLSGSRKSFTDDEPYLKLYQAEVIADGVLGQPKLFAPTLKSRFHDGPIGYAAQSGQLFVTHNSVGTRHGSRKEFVNLKIQKLTRESGRWNYPVDLPFNSGRWSVAHPASTDDGKLLIFVSNNPAGFGGTDLYLSRLEAGGWTGPVNLGPQINTPGNELFPVLSGDSILYFSSDGHGGLGGLDLFACSFSAQNFGPIRNLGYPMNSPADDFGLALAEGGRKGYFSSNRSGGKGKDDLYFFEQKLFSRPVRFLVKEAGSDEPVSLCLLTVLNQHGDTVAAGITNPDGLLQLKLRTGESYRIRSRQRDYSENWQDLILTDSADPAESSVAISLEPLAPQTKALPAPIYLAMENGDPVQVLEVFTIHYDLGQWMLRSDAYDILNPLIDYLSEYPDLEIRIESHADCRGSRELNDKLSERRARVVQNFFVSRYIRPERIKASSYGESRLLTMCSDGVTCEEDEHAVNRRSVIKIVRKGAFDGMRVKRAAFYF